MLILDVDVEISHFFDFADSLGVEEDLIFELTLLFLVEFLSFVALRVVEFFVNLEIVVSMCAGVLTEVIIGVQLLIHSFNLGHFCCFADF